MKKLLKYFIVVAWFFATAHAYSQDSDQSLKIDYSVKNTSTQEAKDGAIQLSVQGGDGKYTFQWFGKGISNINTRDLNSLVKGDYLVVVKDGNGKIAALKIPVKCCN